MSPSRNGSRAGPTAETVREGAQVVAMQRRRLLSAVMQLVYEHGARALTVALICERASLSRRTFYELFEDREMCLLAAFEDEVQQATNIVEQALADEPPGQSWRRQVRVGLTALLSFFDNDPRAARLLVVEALSEGERTLKSRTRVMAQLVGLVDRGRVEARLGREPPPLTAEGVVGAVSSVIHARVLDRDERPLLALTGALMAMIVQPYLGPAVAQRELEKPITRNEPSVSRLYPDPFKGLPMRLTYRTVRVLSSIADTPGASNKQVARAAGIADEGQTSKLLTRLRKYELIRDTGIGAAKGMPRAWSLTERGEGVLQAVGRG
jgi:AcrR family transcriptional regulator